MATTQAVPDPAMVGPQGPRKIISRRPEKYQRLPWKKYGGAGYRKLIYTGEDLTDRRRRTTTTTFLFLFQKACELGEKAWAQPRVVRHSPGGPFGQEEFSERVRSPALCLGCSLPISAAANSHTFVA